MAKKTFALILAVLMILPMIVACADPNGGETTTAPENNATTTAPDGTQAPEETELKSAVLPDDLKFTGETVVFLSRDYDFVRDEIMVEGSNGNVVNDAIFSRDEKVQAKLDVTFESHKITGDQYAVSTELRNAANSGETYFDIIANSTYSTIMYTNENILIDLTDCKYLDLGAVYWSQGFNESASMGDAQYLATGAVSLSLIRYMFCTFYNKKLLADAQQENLYDVVDEGRWTLDYQIKLANELYKDNDGSGTVNEGDTVGFLGSSVLYVDPYWSSCDVRIVSKDPDNYLVYDLDKERLATVVDKLITLFHDSNAWFDKSSGDQGKQDAMGTLFASGTVGTTTMRLCSVETEQFATMEDEYGIIPAPKLNEEQEKAYTFLHDQFTSYGITSVHTGKEDTVQMLGAVLEALAVESYKTVIPTYFELALKGRYLDDSESWRMLDMIYENVKIDAGVLYTKVLNSVHQIPRNMVLNGTNSVISQAAALDMAMKRVLPKFLDAFKD